MKVSRLPERREGYKQRGEFAGASTRAETRKLNWGSSPVYSGPAIYEAAAEIVGGHDDERHRSLAG